MRSTLITLALLLLAGCRSASAPPPPPPPASVPQAVIASQTQAAINSDICATLMKEESLTQPPSIPDNGDGVIRILAFGDFGEQLDSEHNPKDQKKLAKAMKAYHDEHPFDFGITLGDNFYPVGLSDVKDDRWTSQWEEPYSPLGIRVYAILGNHDHYGGGSPEAEMKRSKESKTWCLPRAYYTLTAGPVHLFAVETTVYDEPEDVEGIKPQAQLDWLDEALSDSQAKWKIVYGHHPVYSNGHHGKPGKGTLLKIKEALRPSLLGKVDVYLAGHDHDMQALEPEDGVHFFVSGAAGRKLRNLALDQCRIWGTEQKAFGFTVLEADTQGESLKVSFVGEGEGGQPYKVLWGPTPVEKGATSDCVRP